MVTVGAATHPGRVRTTNEDYFYHGPVPQGYVAIVCDGMGGHDAGEVAARIAAEAVSQFLQEAPPNQNLEELVRDAILFANQRILLQLQPGQSGKFPGSTIVVALATKSDLVYGHVGDSRLYAYAKGTLTLLTEDDSLVHQMLQSGVITAEQALHHPQKNILTQSLGQQPPPTPHVKRFPLRKAQLFLLCSDGFSNSVSKEEIIAVLEAHDIPSLQEKADILVKKANENGGYDNITIVLFQPAPRSATFVPLMNFKLPPQKYLIAGGIAVAVLLLLFLVFSRSKKSSATSPSGEIVIIDSTMSSPVETLSTTSAEEVMPPPTPEEVLPQPVPPPNPPQEASISPEQKPKASVSPKETRPAAKDKKTFDYTIQKGDNLHKLAEIFGVSVAELRQLNGLKDDNIKEGKKLKIPVKAVHTHVVKEKETLSSIARKYDTRVEAIRRANDIENAKIRVGSKLIIPVVKK